MIGRNSEVKELNLIYKSNRAELVAIYGQLGAGKTHLVDEVFADKISFKHAGLPPVNKGNRKQLNLQLEHFYNSLIVHGMTDSDKPTDWLDAFFLLEKLLDSKDNGSRQVVFLDELPWLDTPKSYFISGFESFWNNWACHRKNIMVIVCGSEVSWIKDKLINNCGGLYGRVTWEIEVNPLNARD